MLKLFQKNKRTPAPADVVPAVHAPTPEEVITDKKRVACDGPSFSGHPRIYLDMGKNDRVVCPYCSRTFVYDPAA